MKEGYEMEKVEIKKKKSEQKRNDSYPQRGKGNARQR